MTGDKRIRLLKIGVTRGDTFVHQAYFTTPSMVTIGRTDEAVVRLDHDDVPQGTPLFSLEQESCLLQFKRTMQLAFLYDGLFRTPNYLIDEGLAFRRGRNYYLNLETRARGTLNFGPFRILFKLDFVAPPKTAIIPLPALHELASVVCGHCGQPLDMFLPRPGVMTRCRACRRFNRFEGQALATSEAPPVRPDATGDTPVLLENRVEGPPTAALNEDAMTILDAGVMRAQQGQTTATSTPPAPPVSLTGDGAAEGVAKPPDEPPPVAGTPPLAEPPAGPEPPALPRPPVPPDELAERDTATMTRQTKAERKSARARKRIATGDHLRVVAAAEPAEEESEDAWYEAGAQAGVQAANGGGAVGARVVPLPLTSAPHGAPGLSSAPHHAAMPDPPAAPATGTVTDSYAAAKLADRLTLLVVALVIIAILLACILGVLLTQSAMRRLAVPQTDPADAPGLVIGPDDTDGDV